MAAAKRYGYKGISERRAMRWPNGAGLAVYVALNVEDFTYGEGLVEDLVPGMSQPDVLNSSWRDYGTRIGAYRLLDLFAELDLPATLLLNSLVCSSCPALTERIAGTGHEIAGHGRTNSESQAGLPSHLEAALFETVGAEIAEATGRRPRGWLSPWLAETEATPDLLFAAGYRYILDFCADDQPIWLPVEGGRLLAIPYSQEINDSAAIIGRQTGAAEFANMIIDQVDEMIEQAREVPLVFGLALHANIMGQPFRLRQLRRALRYVAERAPELWITSAGAIADVAHADPEAFV